MFHTFELSHTQLTRPRGQQGCNAGRVMRALGGLTSCGMALWLRQAQGGDKSPEVSATGGHIQLIKQPYTSIHTGWWMLGEEQGREI